MQVLLMPLLIQSSITDSWGCWAILIAVAILVWIVNIFRALRVRIVRQYWVKVQAPNLNQQLIEHIRGLMRNFLVDYPRLQNAWVPSPESIREALRCAFARAETSGRIPTTIEIKRVLESVPKETIKSLTLDLQFAFESLPLDICPIEPPRSLASQVFWDTEHLNRTTKGNRDPKDWPERRRLVHLRDEDRCVRCGIKTPLEKCHIHHLVRRSQGGTHAFSNLVTVCRDCHTCMDEHQHMRAIGWYRFSPSGLIHSSRCRSCRGGKLVRGSLPYLMQRFHAHACPKCRPWEKHKKKMVYWTPGVCSTVSESFHKLTTEELLGPVAGCVVDPPRWLSPLARSVEGLGWSISAGLPLSLFIWICFLSPSTSKQSIGKQNLAGEFEEGQLKRQSAPPMTTGNQSAPISSSAAVRVKVKQWHSTSTDSKFRHDVADRIQREFGIQMDPDKYSLSQLTDFELRHSTSIRIQREFGIPMDPDKCTLSQLMDFELRHSTSNRIQREFGIPMDPDKYTLSQLTDFELRHSTSNRIQREFGIWLDPDKYSLSSLIDLELKHGSPGRSAR